MGWIRDLLSRTTGPVGNVDAIERADHIVTTPDFAPLLAGKSREVEAVRLLRQQVPGLGLVDATTIVRRHRAN